MIEVRFVSYVLFCAWVSAIAGWGLMIIPVLIWLTAVDYFSDWRKQTMNTLTATQPTIETKAPLCDKCGGPRDQDRRAYEFNGAYNYAITI